MFLLHLKEGFEFKFQLSSNVKDAAESYAFQRVVNNWPQFFSGYFTVLGKPPAPCRKDSCYYPFSETLVCIGY